MVLAGSHAILLLDEIQRTKTQQEKIMLSLVDQYELKIIADDFISQVKNAIRTRMIRRRSRRPGVGIFEAAVNASGKLAESVHAEWTDEGVEIKCLEYIDKLIYGQAPGQAPNVSDI